MSKLLYRTIADERPQGKPNVYFSCHPDDFGKYFEEYTSRILKIQDCAIWYESEPEEDYDKDDLELNLSQMQLFVMPVTTKLLTEPCRAMVVELPLSKGKHIPVLPLMMEQGLDDVFARYFGDLQYLDPNNKDETKRKFDEVLETYIKSVLVSNELAEKVRAAFDAYIFLSYRKKDRRKAQELMRLIHRNPLCRDIAIWYDEFLTPGEDFNDAIGKMLQKSDLFALVVTPNLVNEPNYVMTTEYPAAVEQDKPVLPVEMEETDRGKLEEHYKGLPPCVKGEENETFRTTLLEKIRSMAVEANDEEPEHNYLIGLAYLDGIDVEVDTVRALKLITGAADAGVPEAMEQLVVMYETGKGVRRDYHEGVRWREKHVGFLRQAYDTEPIADKATKLISSLWSLGDAQYELRDLDAAQAAYSEMHTLSEQNEKSGEVQYTRYVAFSCKKLGYIAEKRGDLLESQMYYEKSRVIDEKLSERTGTIELRRELSISYCNIGRIAEAVGDFAIAQFYYEQALAVDEELSEKAGTIESRENLSNDYIGLGDIAKSRGDLSSGYLRIGDIADDADDGEDPEEAQKCYKEALKYYEQALAIDKELSARTETIGARRRLSISYDRLGDIAEARRDFTGAQRYFMGSLAIRKEIAEKTGTIQAIEDLLTSYENLGDIAMASGDVAGARDYYEKVLATAEMLVEKAGTIESRRDLAFGYNKMGDVFETTGDHAEALEYYGKGLAICQELAEETRTPQAYRDLATALFNLGVFYHNNMISDDKAKTLFMLVVKLGKGSSDEFLYEISEEAQSVLDNEY